MRYFKTLALVLLLSSHAFAQTHFKFAWLSDTHVGSETGEEDLRRSVADINAMNDIAFVIHSGDVTEMGSDKELNIAKRLLDSLNKPHYICPGNHDTKWSESGCTRFPKLFGNDKFVFEYGRFRFIGLHQGPRMRMGDGHWAPEDMRWLDSVLAAIPDRQQPLFFVTHYPVDSSISNWYVMLDKVKRYNMQAILHGHGHRNGVFNFEGVAGIMSRSNLRARDSVGGYTIAEVRNDTLFVSERTPGIRTSTPWHLLTLNPIIYHSRPDISVTKPESVTVKWKFKSGWTIASTPAVDKNSVYIGDASGTLNCINLKNGNLRWQVRTAGPIYSSPLIVGRNIVFGSADSTVYCVSSKNGKLTWHYETSAAFVSAPQKNRDLVFLGGSDRKFRAVESRTGEFRWMFTGIEDFIETQPLVYNGKVFFGAWDQHIYALDEQTGTLIWKWKGDKQGTLLSPAACLPVAANGKVFIVAPDRMMTAINAETGKQVWRTGKYQVRESIGISEDGERVYIRTLRDSILALSTSANEPQEVWCTNVGFGYDHNYAALVEKDGTLFYGTRNGLLIALDARNGSVKWQYKTGVALLNTVAPIDGRRVVVSNVDGEVMLVEADE